MWHYTINNNPQEPIEEAAIAQLISNGQIPSNTLVWREGMTDWTPFESTDLVRYAVAKGAAPVMGALAGAAPNRQVPAANPYAPPQAAPRQIQPAAGSSMTWKKILWSFEGRIPRRTYWAGIGIWIGIMFSLVILMGLLTPLVGEDNAGILSIPILLVIIPYCWSLLAMQIKRWHDRGKSGWMVLVNFIPFVGGIWAFVECGCLRGTFGDNEHGQDPT